MLTMLLLQVEAEDGQIFTGFCMEGTCMFFHLCAERAALFNMYQFSGQTKVKKNPRLSR